jgi:hypothetical protein
MIRIHFSRHTLKKPNKAAAPNAAMALQLTIEDNWRGVGEPRRWAAMAPCE